jgi:hypothetical protein
MRPTRNSPRAARPARLIAGLLFALLATGCGSMLPDARTETQITWTSYEEARADIDRIVPFKSKREDLAAMGLDPLKNSSVTILTWSDLLQRFASGSVLKPEDLDPGVRQCLVSGKSCTAYWIVVRKVERERIGSFWLDSLNFRRETDIHGWSVNALVVLVDDVVVYTLFGGQPKIHERELVRNPLGPLQQWGDQVPSMVK